MLNSIGPKARIAFAHDVAMAGLTFVAAGVMAVWLRAAGDWSVLPLQWILIGALVQMAVAAPTFLILRLYTGVWRYASIPDLIQILRAASVVAAAVVALMFLITRLDGVPRSALLLNWFFLIGGLAGPRLFYRIWRDRRAGSARNMVCGGVPTLIIGATDTAETFLREMLRIPSPPYHVLGLIDDRGGRVGRVIHRAPVLGGLDDLETLVARLKAGPHPPQRLVVARETMAPTALKALIDRADALGLTVARLPRVTDFDGPSAADQLRPIAIEDVLGRARTVLDPAGPRAMLEGKRALVTGAGGSIGGELCRRIAEMGAARIDLVEAGEHALYQIDLELADGAPNTPRRAWLADVRDAPRIAEVMAEARPDVVFHAAALKHVPLVEGDPGEGARTNALGTRIVAEACRAAATPLMVMISTDKAINPPNVMGATKRVAERWCQALDRLGAEEGGTRFATVRFGNVLGSTGSVVPLFQRQLARGGPLTVTDPEMKRYFMTIREAVELVLHAGAMDATGAAERAPGQIYVLDMGEPVKILDLAHRMIRLAGMERDGDVKIVFTGLRPGEKLFEELFDPAENPSQTRTPGVLTAAPEIGDLDELRAGLDRLDAAARSGDAAAIRAALHAIAPEYAPQVKDDAA